MLCGSLAGMDGVPLESARRAALRPWLLILLTAPVVTAGLGLLVYRWQSQKQDIAHFRDQFIQRQNKTLIHDATTVSQGVADLLLQAARDARILASLRPDAGELERFFRAVAATGAVSTKKGDFKPAFPRYNRMAVLRDGRLTYFTDKGRESAIAALAHCFPGQLCDRATLEAAEKLVPGRSMVGKGLRLYTPESGPRDKVHEGTLSVAYRGPGAIYVLGIDFRSLNALTRLPTFPYDPRGDPLLDYENGNYIYLLDKDTDVLAHPKPWHVMGLDPATGQPVPPMRTDADAGMRPLNFRAYQDGKLRPYFDRLIQRSFLGTEVDLFPAANLSGQIRVVSIAPVFLDAEVFDQKGPFGYVGVGCSLEHFQEPEERLVPYY